MRLYIFIAVWDCTRLNSGWESDCQSHHLLLHPIRIVAGSSHCATAWAGHLQRNADNLLAMLPMKQRRCAEQYRLISLQFSLQACQPDLPQSLRINTPGLLQPSDSMLSHFKTWNVDTFQCYRLAETLLRELFALLSRVGLEDHSYVCTLHMKLELAG